MMYCFFCTSFYNVKRSVLINIIYNSIQNKHKLPPIELTAESVENIHHEGGKCNIYRTLTQCAFMYLRISLTCPSFLPVSGTILGSSRGGFDIDKICEFIKSKKIKQLYVIGGDGVSL